MIALYLGGALATFLVMVPALLGARGQLGFPAVSSVGGIPVAVYGVYFYTILALVVAGIAASLRGAPVVVAAVLAVAGLGTFEFLYGVAFATTANRSGLLVPGWGLPTAGWAGFGTWLLAEFLVASFALVNWDRAGLDRITVAVGVTFLLGLTVWDVLLNWRYPPFDNSTAVFLVNTFTEVAGTLFAPLVFTSRFKTTADFLHRIWSGIESSGSD